MSHIICPCNGLARCWRHPTGCATIVTTAREDWALRQKRKARRRRLWYMLLRNYKIRAKWGMGPIPRQYHLNVVLLLEELLGEEELSRQLAASNSRKEESSQSAS